MKNMLKYGEYQGTAEVDTERHVCRGKILFIEDLVTYEASSAKALQSEFEAAVDDYVATCAELNRQPRKLLKGAFNVRVPPPLHEMAATKAISEGISLNEVVVQALQHFLSKNVHSETRGKTTRAPLRSTRARISKDK